MRKYTVRFEGCQIAGRPLSSAPGQLFRPSAQRRWTASPTQDGRAPTTIRYPLTIIRPIHTRPPPPVAVPPIFPPKYFRNNSIVHYFDKCSRMISAWRVMTMYVMILTILPEIAVQNIENNLDNRPFLIDRRLQDILPYATNEEYVRRIHSMINANSQRGDSKKNLVIETNARIDTKYRTEKRNADLINSLLGLPKWMDEAGR